MAVREQDVLAAQAKVTRVKQQYDAAVVSADSALSDLQQLEQSGASTAQINNARQIWESERSKVASLSWNLSSAETDLSNKQQAYQLSLREISPNRRLVTSATAYADATDSTREGTISAVQQAAASGAPDYELDPARQQAIEDEELYQSAIDAVDQARDAVREVGPGAIDQLELPEDFYDPKADAGAPPPDDDGGPGILVEAENVDNRIRIRPFSIDLRKQLYGGLGADVNENSLLAPLQDSAGVLFPYTPTISFQQGVSYQEFQPTHANTSYMLYQNTPAVKFTITGKFSAQNQEEARYMLAVLHFFRTITKMRFGASTPNRGHAPPVCLLSGYGLHMFNDLPIIITNFSMELPENVNYVTVEVDGFENQVPSLTSISVECVVQQTPQKHRDIFNWDEFASGSLLVDNPGWF